MFIILKRLNLIRPLTARFVHKKLCGPHPEPTYNVRIAHPEDYQNMMTFMATTYCNIEPILVNLGIAGCPSNSLLKMLRTSMLQGMSLLAEDTTFGCVVGVSVNTLSVPRDLKVMREIACNETGLYRDLFNFYAYAMHEADVWQRFNQGIVFECAHLCVHPDHQAHGLATRLVMDSWALARDLGLRVFVIHCTNKYTIKVAENYKMNCISKIPFRDHCYEGRFIFNSVQEPHTELKTYTSDLYYYKGYYPPCSKK